MNRHEPPSNFAVEFFRDFMTDPPPKQWIVRGLFAWRELSVVYGAPGDGKSVLIGDIACHVAAGRPWFGRPVTRGGVLYIAAERAALVKRRMHAWGKRYGIADIPLAVIDNAPNLVGTEDARRLQQTLYRLDGMEEEPTWIIVDTKARTMGGGDENAAKDMNAFVDSLALLQASTGCHVTVIDHVPHHDKTRMRGHSALLGAADVTFRVSKTGGARLVEIDKVNDGPDDIRIGFDLETVVIGRDDEGDMTAPVVVPTEAPVEKTSSSRRLSDRQRLALEALHEAVASQGQPVPASFGLPRPVSAVGVAAWREEIERRGIIDSEVKNKRGAFSDLRTALAARKAIGIRDELVWAA